MVVLDRRLRVLHVVLNLHQGGLERVLGDLARGMDRTQFEQHILAVEYLGDLARGLDQHVTLHLADRQGRLSLLHPASLAKQIRNIAPDIAHTHSGVWFKGSLAATRAQVPFIVHTDHGRQSPDPFVHRLTDSLASRRTDAIIAVSEVLGKQLADTVVRDPSRIHIIPNGIDTTRFRPWPGRPDIRAELGVTPETPVIGSIGRLDPIKRFDVMIHAFASLCGSQVSGPAPVLVIAGEGPERKRLETSIRDHGLSDRVHLLGWRSDVHTLHATFTLFTMSSRSEGTSIGLLEAMSAELCPIVTRVGGNAAVLGPTLAHRLCPPENVEALARAWRDALDDPLSRQRDAAAARIRVLEAFSLDRMVEGHRALYEAGVRRARR